MVNHNMESASFLSIVDDEADIMSLFRDALTQTGHGRVVGFTDSPLALDHFKLNLENYSLVLSDCRIPEMNGIELLKKVKSINPKVKTILISAFDVEERLFEDSECVDKILQKPISIPELINEVEVQIDNN